MRHLEFLKSLSREEQSARRCELADAAYVGDIFHRPDGRFVVLEARRSDGTWCGDLLEDMDGNPASDGWPGCYGLVITADEFVDLNPVPRPPRRPDVKLMATAVKNAVGTLNILHPYLDGMARQKAGEIVAILDAALHDFKRGRPNDGRIKVSIAERQMLDYPEGEDGATGLAALIEDEAASQAVRNQAARLGNACMQRLHAAP